MTLRTSTSSRFEALSSNWSRVDLFDEPYRWAFARPDTMIPIEIARACAHSFPVYGMQRIDKSARIDGKRYRNYSLQIQACEDFSEFPSPWQALLCDLQSELYISKMADLLGSPQATRVELRLVLHGPNDWLDPHTDDPSKAFTQVFYFNANWHDTNGGNFEVLGSSDPNDIAARVVPELGASVILVPTNRSWHQVGSICSGKQLFRRSLVVHGLYQP